MSRLLLLLVPMCLWIVSCVTDKSLQPAPVPSHSPSGTTPVPAAPKPAPAAAPAKTPDPSSAAASKDCQALPDGLTLPYFLKGSSVIFIGFLKSCRTSDGQEGYVKGSSWTAMGFPCTAGNGRIDKKGSESVPSVVSFHLQNSCPMQPGRTEDVEQLVRQNLAIAADSKLIAYYPLSVDYWEFVDFTEHDVGYRLELFTTAAINTGWQKFTTKGEPLKVRLYGRENSWKPTRKLYEVLGQLVPDEHNSFRLEVEQAQVLDDAARASVRERCDTLRPKRNCEEFFGP